MKSFPIAKFDGARGADELVIYTKSGKTGTNNYGIEACVVNERVVKFGKNDNAVPEGGYVVSGHGKAARFIADALCVGAKAVIDKENGVFYAEVDAEAMLINAEGKIALIESRVQKLNEKNASFESEKVKELLAQAKEAKEKGDFDTVNTLTEEAYYYTAESVKGEVRAVWHRPHEKSDEEV